MSPLCAAVCSGAKKDPRGGGGKPLKIPMVGDLDPKNRVFLVILNIRLNAISNEKIKIFLMSLFHWVLFGYLSKKTCMFISTHFYSLSFLIPLGKDRWSSPLPWPPKAHPPFHVTTVGLQRTFTFFFLRGGWPWQNQSRIDHEVGRWPGHVTWNVPLKMLVPMRFRTLEVWRHVCQNIQVLQKQKIRRNFLHSPG